MEKNRLIVILFVRITWSYYYLEKTKLVKQKKQPNGPVQADSAITKESNLIISYVIPFL
jgi:hypothetical protein